MAAASLTWLRLQLCGDKCLPVVHETDDLVTSNNVDVQVWFPIPIAIFKRKRDRFKVLSCAKQARPNVYLRLTGVPPRHFHHQNLPVEIDRDEVASTAPRK